MINEWEITERIEICNEGFADLVASFFRYFNINNISIEDRNNKVVKYYFKIFKYKNDLLSCHSLTDVQYLENKLLDGRNFLKRLYDE